MTRERQHFAIIGGGFAGTAFAIELLRSYAGPLDLLLIDREDRFCLGHGIGSAKQIRNICAANMSVIESKPRHLVAWLAATRDENAEDPTAWERRFISRKEYGDYLESSLRAAAAAAAPRISVRYLTDDVTALYSDAEGVTLSCTHHGQIDVDRAIVCVGDPTTMPPRLGVDAITAVTSEDKVVLIGAGPTTGDGAAPMTPREPWEITAVPDIRKQCAALAAQITRETSPAARWASGRG